MKMIYNYEKVSLSGNKNDQVINNFRIINKVPKSQVYLIQGISFNYEKKEEHVLTPFLV